MPIILLIIFLACLCPRSNAEGTNQITKYKDGSSLINKMLGAASDLDSYSFNYQMLVYKKNETVQQTGTIYFCKPRLLRVEVNLGPKKGSVAILCSDGKIHGHLGGIMKYFNFAISADSDLARAANDFPMAGTDFYSLACYLKNMLQEGALSQTSQRAECTDKASVPTYILEMYSLGKNKNSSQLLLLKRIYVNSQTYLPVFWEDYRDAVLWSQTTWKNLHSNIELPDSLFKP
jgi:outer membrane lipoprotein-sorting protein